jgi:predicted lysophospholipase L1 biosynthesis ABC-type transport system permease subunit
VLESHRAELNKNLAAATIEHENALIAVQKVDVVLFGVTGAIQNYLESRRDAANELKALAAKTAETYETKDEINYEKF